MKTIKINEDELRETIKRAVCEMENRGWEGWKCDVCYNPETNGFFISEPYSGYRYYTYPGVFPFTSIDRWLLNKGEDREEIIDNYTDNVFDDILERKSDIEAINNINLVVEKLILDTL